MNPRGRGCLYLVVFLAFAAFFCGIVPFVLLPNGGTAVALPVIEVPGEVVTEGGFFGMNLTNTIIGTLVTNVLVLLIVFILWRLSKGWTRQVPGRLQGMFEVLIGGFRSFSKNIGGEKLDKTPMLWPLVASIFFFLLVANYMKLLPGVETVGKLHCAYEGQSGFKMITGAADSARLYVDEPLNAGTAQSEQTYNECNNYFLYGEIPEDGFPAEAPEEIQRKAEVFEALLVQLPTDEELEAQVSQTNGEEASAPVQLVSARPFTPDLLVAEDEYSDLTEDQQEELDALKAERAEEYLALVEETITGAEENPEGVDAGRVDIVEGTTYDDADHYLKYAEERLADAQTIAVLDPRADAIEAMLEQYDVDEVTEEVIATRQELAATLSNSIQSADNSLNTAESDALLALLSVADVSDLDNEAGDDLRDALNAELNALDDALLSSETQLRYPRAPLVLTEDQLGGEVRPYIFHITPFVRGPATDLSFTFGLAILAVIIVQVYGVMALGPAYFEKFVNLTAVGKAGKRPLGIIDFVVGLIEIISEIGKAVSLAFRLFGNLFAGGVALMAMTFLLAWIVPGVIYGLELIIGAVQALVFAVLTLVFSVQAMEHHGDHDHDDHHDEAEHVAH